ncbi:MAG: hypothetical protein NVS3B20_13280 [Polyangiales bacterium]
MKSLFLAAAVSFAILSQGCTVANVETDDPSSASQSEALQANALSKDSGKRIALIPSTTNSIPGVTHVEFRAKPGSGLIVRGLNGRKNDPMFELLFVKGGSSMHVRMQPELTRMPDISQRLVDTLREAAKFPKRECMVSEVMRLAQDMVAGASTLMVFATCVPTAGLFCAIVGLNVGTAVSVTGYADSLGSEKRKLCYEP